MSKPGEITTSGWFKAVEDGRLARGKVNTIFRVAMYNATKDYMADNSSDGFGVRFKHEGFSLLGLYERSSAYQARQNRQYRNTLPFFGPRSKGQTGMPHMRDLLKVVGSGYNITPTATQYSIKIKLTLPGARKMNQGKNKYYRDYQSQLLGWDAGARWQAVKIMNIAVHNSITEIMKHAK